MCMYIAEHENISYILGSTVEALCRVQKCISFSGPISGPMDKSIFPREDLSSVVGCLFRAQILISRIDCVSDSR